LDPTVLYDRFLNWVRLAILDQSLDCDDFMAFRIDGEEEAGRHRLTVEQNGTCTAVSGITTQVSAVQFEIIAQNVEQGSPRVNIDLVGIAIHIQSYMMTLHADF
jgi:hypothetical protein